MPSIRELILQHLLAVTVAAFPGVSVKRSRTLPSAKDTALAIRMFADSEDSSDMPSQRKQRELRVNFKLFVRGVAPDEIADEPLTTLTQAVLADIRCGGFATQVQETGTTWDYDADVSEDFGEVTASFLITYYTNRADQTVQA